jgi:hypothetical protein
LHNPITDLPIQSLSKLTDVSIVYPPLLSEKDNYVVDFTGPKDPLHGQNWPLRKKITTAAVLGFATFVCSWGSSIYSSATFAVSREWDVSNEVSILGMSTYVLGFAFGPLICMFPIPAAIYNSNGTY